MELLERYVHPRVKTEEEWTPSRLQLKEQRLCNAALERNTQFSEAEWLKHCTKMTGVYL